MNYLLKSLQKHWSEHFEKNLSDRSKLAKVKLDLCIFETRSIVNNIRKIKNYKVEYRVGTHLLTNKSENNLNFF